MIFQHQDQSGETPEWIGEGLRRSILNYLEGSGLTLDVRQWFDHSVPKPRVSPTWVPRLLKGRIVEDDPLAERRFVWLGGQPVCEPVGRRTRLILPGHTSDQAVTVANQQAQWLDESDSTIHTSKQPIESLPPAPGNENHISRHRTRSLKSSSVRPPGKKFAPPACCSYRTDRTQRLINSQSPSPTLRLDSCYAS